jgi:hypothetical protein
MALTQLCDVKARLGITSTDYDDMINDMINAVSLGIENYCDRSFDVSDYIEEKEAMQYSIVLNNQPINKIYGAYYGDTNVIELEYSGSGMCSYEVYTDKVVIYSDFVETEYLFADYTTLDDLATALNTHADLTAEIADTNYSGWSPKLLWTGSQAFDYSGSSLYLQAPTSPATLSKQFDGLYLTNSDTYHKVIYNGGYSSIPADLQEIATKATVVLFNNRNQDGNKKSETIGDYSYTEETSVADGDIEEVIGPFVSALNKYVIKQI